MEEKRYIISDASKILNVESHVLRYWEEELEIKIPRNEMGHRYYTQKEIDKLKSVRDLKRQGYGLRSIRMMINGTVLSSGEKYEGRAGGIRNLKSTEVMPNTYGTPCKVIDKEEKMEQFKEIMGNIIKNAIKESQDELKTDLGNKIGEHLDQSLDKKIGGELVESISKTVDGKLIQTESRINTKIEKQLVEKMKLQEQKAEERYKRLDEAIRLKQKNTKKREKKQITNVQKPSKTSKIIWDKIKKPQLG